MSTGREGGDSAARIVLIVLGIVGGVTLLVALVCGGLGFLLYRAAEKMTPATLGVPVALTPEMELQNTDYAEDRKQFKTRLVEKGPAPQDADEVQTPEGVKEVEYPSGNLRLKAWVTEPPKDGGKRPAVLFLHGGFAFGEDDWETARPYRDAGFVVMTPMLRGENDQPGFYSMFYDEVEDVLA